MFVSVAVGSTWISLEDRDLKLCSKSLCSSSALRTSLLVGVAHARKQKTIQTTESMQIQSAHEVKHTAQQETRPTTVCVEGPKALAANVKGCTEVDWARSGSETSYLSESSARSSVRSRSPSMMTSLRATFRCSTTKCYSSARTTIYFFPHLKTQLISTLDPEQRFRQLLNSHWSVELC